MFKESVLDASNDALIKISWQIHISSNDNSNDVDGDAEKKNKKKIVSSTAMIVVPEWTVWHSRIIITAKFAFV